jgi:4-amino-4-deoxy-L-arabinose transferase-like glycosyltransferase
MRSPLFWLACLYLAVGVIYASVTPPLEKSDEHGHYGYILYLREYRALPTLRPYSGSQPVKFKGADQPSTWLWLASEFRQPPLYYIVAAALTSWLPDDPDPDQLVVLNPYARSAVPVYRNDNRNRFLHPPEMTPLILATRLVTLLFGLGSMLASYWLAAQLFPKNSLVPVTTAAIVGFQPTFLYIATAVNNDAAIAFLGTLIGTILMYRLRQGPLPHFAVMVGALLGLASITKVSGLAFFPLVGLALLWIHRGLRSALFRDGIIIVAAALLIGGWWYVRNAIFYNDPFTAAAHATKGATEVRPLLSRLSDLPAVEHTYWANPAHIFVSAIGLDQLLIWWGRISLGLLVVGSLLNYKSIRANLPAWIVLLSWPATFLFLLIGYWDQQVAWSLGRLLFPAIAPTTLLLVLGWHSAFPSRWRRTILTLCAGTVMVVGVLVPFVSVRPLYHPSREWQAEQVEHPVGTVFVDPQTGPVAQLIGYNLPRPYAVPGTYFPVELCWKPLGQTNTPYAAFVNLLDLSQLSTNDSPGTWGRRETYPGLGNRPTDRWTLFQVFCDMVFIRVFPETPTPMSAAIEVGFTDAEKENRLLAVDPAGDPIALAVIGRAPILLPQEAPTARQPASYILDNAIGLDRAQISGDADGSLTLTVTWQSLQPVLYDATMFIHLRGADGNILAQADRQPLNGRFPTSSWLPGQVITDVVSLSLGPDAYDKPLVLNVGMYVWPSLQRLPVRDASGALQPEHTIVMDVPPLRSAR